jgi:hypothetical protein
LLHLAGFCFGDVAFAGDRRERRFGERLVEQALKLAQSGGSLHRAWPGLRDGRLDVKADDFDRLLGVLRGCEPSDDRREGPDDCQPNCL